MHRILKSLLVFALLAAAGFAADDFAETKKKAEAGDANAQYNLSLMYANGTGVPQDDVEALKWLRKADDQRVKEEAVSILAAEAPNVRAAREQAEEAREQAEQAPNALAAAARKQAAREQAEEARKQAARKQAATEAYAKSTDRAVKLVIKGLAIGMSIDAALEVVNERLSGVLNQKFEIKRSDTFGAYLSLVPDSSPQKINEGNGGLLMSSLLFTLIPGNLGWDLPLSFCVICEVNNNVVTRIVLPAKLTNVLFNTADMQASDFLLQIRQNYGVGLKAGDWTVFQFSDFAETNWTGWEYSSPEGYRIRVFDDKAIEMKKIPKSSERRFN